MKRTRKHVWWAIVFLGLLALTVAGAATLKISAREVLSSVASFSTTTLFQALGLLGLYNIVLVLRLYLLVPEPRQLSFTWTANAIALGQGANYFFPARAGDALKVIILSRGKSPRSYLPADTGTGIILADKVVDIAAVIAFALATGAYRVPGVRFWPEFSRWEVGIGIALIAGGFFVAKRIWPNGLWRRVLRNIGKGFRGTTRPTQLVPSFFCGLLVWAVEGSALVLLCQAQGFETGIGQAILALIVLNALIAIPITFANIGPYEAALAFGLVTVGIDTVPALAIALTHHFLVLLNSLVFIALSQALVLGMRQKPLISNT